MAPSEPMPRYSLYRSPWCSTTSPGDSSTPASSEPSITTSAPAASALGMSPDSWIPPSATSVMPCRFAATAQSWMAVICGTPTPATTRVVQIAPGPYPDLHAVGAGGDHRVDGFGGDDVAADDLDVEAALDLLDDVEHALASGRGTVSTTRRSTPAATRRLGSLEGVGPDADGGGDPEAAPLVLGGERGTRSAS